MTAAEEEALKPRQENIPILNDDEKTEKTTIPNGQNWENGDVNTPEELPENTHSSPKGVLAQSFVAGAVFLLTTCCGIHVGYSAILLPQLKAENGTLHIDDELGSWIASVQSIASPVGAFLSGLLMDRWGRRSTLILCTIPFMVSWLLLTFATKHLFILIARAMAGFASGLTIGPTQVLVGEISEPRIRGILTGTNFMSHSIGILLVYIMGAVMDWSTVSAISTVFPFLSLVAFVLLPESPVWLVRHNKVEEAEKALRWLRGGGVGLQARRELDQLISRFRAEKEEVMQKRMSERGAESSSACCGTLSKPQVLKPFIIVSVFYLVQVISGTYLVIFYAVEVITEAGGREGLGIDSYFAAVLTATDRLLFTFIMCFLLLRVGRRPLALVSGFLQAFSSIVLATFLYMRNGIKITDYEFPLCKYFIIASMLLYVATNTCGYFSMPGIAMGELLPAKVRGSIGGYILACTYIGFFVTTKIFPWLCSVLGVHGVFAVFGIVGLIGTFFMYLVLPESSGKSLAQIENYFCQPNMLWVGRNRVLRKYNWRPEDFELQVRR